MLESHRSSDHLELLEVAQKLLADTDATVAATKFGIDELLSGGRLGPEEQRAVYAFLEAQGYHAGTSSVLSRFALTDVIADGHPDVVGSLYGEHGDEAGRLIVAGWRPGDRVVARSARGLTEVVNPSRVPAPAELDEHQYVVTLEPQDDLGPVRATPDWLAAKGSQISARLMLGAAAESLGACTRLIDDAVEHTSTRRQFGHELAHFPPVQAMLAWAAAERHQVRTFLDLAISLPVDDPRTEQAAMVAKGIAGRAGRAVAQHTLQATGGIAFTWEYSHHRFHRRLLALDAVGGLSADIAADLGRLVRTTGMLPDFVNL